MFGMKFKLFGWLLTAFAVFALAGCGSSSSSSSGSLSNDTTTTSVSGTISDPYIYQAYFGEFSADGELLQETTEPSTKKGVFTFPEPLTLGSTIRMKTTDGVFHVTPAGKVDVYEGPILTRRVSQKLADGVESGEKVVVTPLTTLVQQRVEAKKAEAEQNGETFDEQAADAAEEAVVDEVVASLGVQGVNKDNLFNDPMAAFEEGGDNDVSLLQASMAVNMAMESSDFDGSLRKAVKLTQTIFPTGIAPREEQFVAANAIALTVSGSETPDDVLSNIDNDVENVVKNVIEAAESNTADVVEVSETGTVEAVNYQEKFTAAYQNAFGSTEGKLAPILEGEVGVVNAEVIALAKELGNAKKTLQLAEEAGVQVEVSQQERNQLNFFYAFSRVALLANPLSDGNDVNGLQRLSDILDAFDVDKETSVREENFGLETCTEVTTEWGVETECTSNIFPEDANGNAIIPDTTPNTAQLQEFLHQRAATEIEGAIAALDQVSSDFEKVYLYEGYETEFDYSDALYIKALANAALFQINFQQGVDIRASIKDIAELADAESTTLQDIMNLTNANDEALADTFLKTRNAEALAEAKEYAVKAAEGLKTAVQSIRDEEDEQYDDLITFYHGLPEEQAADIADTLAEIDEALAILEGPTEFTTSDGEVYTLDLTKVFAGEVDLNSLLPPVTGDQPGMFPDPTMGGVLSKDIGVNEDTYDDGVPDILQDGPSRFTEKMLAGNAFRFYAWPTNNTEISGGEFLLEVSAVDNTYTLFYPVGQTATGTWAISEDGQEVVLTQSGAEFATLVFDEAYFDEEDVDGFDLQFVLVESDGTEWYCDADVLAVLENYTIPVESASSIYLNMYNSDYFGITLNVNDGTYSGYKGQISFGGTWNVNAQGQFVLAPSEACTVCNGESTYTFEHAYDFPYGDPIIIFSLDNDNVDGEKRAFWIDVSYDSYEAPSAPLPVSGGGGC
jgi:hypothetical protein